jgi:signal transduction histidine kinase
VKYRDPAEPRRWVRIEGELRNTGGACEIVVRVRDNGLGVPEEGRDKLFQRFFRAHETVTGEEGTGLGLSLVREAIEASGGRVWAEFPARGSVFALSVPCTAG